jgi:antitoxin component of MazEF toxin-antitoxin module
MVVRRSVCGKGSLRPGTIHEELFGVSRGDYPSDISDRCGESFLSSERMQQVEARAKEPGLRGLASKVIFPRSGNSLVVRIPSQLARYLKLKSGQAVLVSPEKENRLLLELAWTAEWPSRSSVNNGFHGTRHSR